MKRNILFLLVAVNLFSLQNQGQSQVSGIKTLDIQPFINQMEERLENVAKPSPEIVEAFVEELQASCQTNRTIDMTMMVS